MKLNVANGQLQVARPNPAAGGTFNFQLSTFNPVRAFSLVELLIAMALMSLIVISLMQVFSSTQRAFRAGVSQSDVMEGGRAAMDLIATDLRGMAASGGVSNGAVNFSVEGISAYDNTYAPLHQSLPGGSDVRTNLLNAIFILGRENTTWTGVGYYVDYRATKSLYPLYRFYVTTNINNNPQSLRVAFFNAINNNLASGQWTNMSHIIDGVVHLSLNSYDPGGDWIRYDYNFGHSQIPNVNIYKDPSKVWPETRFYFFGNTLPMAVELEFAKLEDRAVKRAESLPNNVPGLPPLDRRSIYLKDQSGNVHVFRQHIPIPNADRAAYQ